MAKFEEAWANTSKNEGGYVNNSKDRGKETYRGISIVFNPNWEGWLIVHKTIKDLGITNTLDCPKIIRDRIDKALTQVQDLDGMVQNLYKKNYWDPLNLNEEISQLIADKIFDIGVNMGVGQARKIYESAKNV